MTTDKEHLQWIHNRIVEVYGESENVDFLIRMRQIIDKQDTELNLHSVSRFIYSHKSCEYDYIGEFDTFINQLSNDGYDVVQILSTEIDKTMNRPTAKSTLLVRKLYCD